MVRARRGCSPLAAGEAPKEIPGPSVTDINVSFLLTLLSVFPRIGPTKNVREEAVAGTYDFVVVGSGHNGLTAAAYLATAGKKYWSWSVTTGTAGVS